MDKNATSHVSTLLVYQQIYYVIPHSSLMPNIKDVPMLHAINYTV